MTIWRMRIACWITKPTDTHTNSEYTILTALRRQRRLSGRVNVTLYIHGLALFTVMTMTSQLIAANIFVLDSQCLSTCLSLCLSQLDSG